MTINNLLRQKVLLDYGREQSLRKCANSNNVSKSSVSNWVCVAKGLTPIKKKLQKSNKYKHVKLLISNYVQQSPLVCASWTLYESGEMTGIRMSEFIKNFIQNKYNNYLIIMNNGGAHKKECVKETIQETNNKLLYSVPCPKTNAIESLFSQFKHYFNHDETGLSFSELEKQ